MLSSNNNQNDNEENIDIEQGCDDTSVATTLPIGRLETGQAVLIYVQMSLSAKLMPSKRKMTEKPRCVM